MSAEAAGQHWTVLSVLNWTTERFAREGIESPRLDAELLLAHSLAVERLRLYLDYDKPLSAAELAGYRELIKRRLRREPVAYITGTREFWSMELTVRRGVLVPRPETEGLVEQALRLARQLPTAAPLVVDVGTGSGAIALALARELPEARVCALDSDADALALARHNAQQLQLKLELFEGDLLRALPTEVGQPQLIIANLPYIASAVLQQLEPEVARWEPRGALDGGPEGLDLIRSLVPQARERLATGGWLLLEIGHDQGAAVSELLRRAGFAEVTVQQDLAQLDRVVSGCRPG